MSKATTLAAIERMDPEATAQFVAMISLLHSEEIRDCQLHEVEEETAEMGREILRLALQSHVRSRGNGDVGEALLAESQPTGTDEESSEDLSGNLILLSHRRNRYRGYKSQFGWIDIDRLGYGSRGETSLHPLDEELSLPERKTGYPVQKEICIEVARGPYQEAARALERRGVPVAAANVDNVARDAARNFEEFYEQTTPSHEEKTSEILVATIDCKGIRIQGLPKVVPKKDGDPKRTGKKRMATVAAVYTIEPYVRTPEDLVKELRPGIPLKVVKPRPGPESKRVWASLKRGKDEIFNEVGQEMNVRDPSKEKTWIGLTDGEKALQKRALLLGLILILDLFHVIEYLWEMARVFYPKLQNGDDDERAKKWVSKRLLLILQGKASAVVRGIRQSATKKGLRGKKRKILDKATGYFMNNLEFMRYDEYLAAGYPIGSGVVEGSVRHLINDRLERTGMTWSEDGAEAVLKLRALEISGDTDAYWDFHIEREHERLYGAREWEVAA